MRKWNEYWISKAPFGFTNRRFFNAKIATQPDLDLISCGFIIRDFVKRSQL